ncbi:MAG: helix-turn-helix domain-containing protein [Erysipelotrichaceae bacterium]|nr:helix-turn-helix domain-containing protein [Erysipelotrichaceae bacterium]
MKISQEIGKKIRYTRQSQHMTLDELAKTICKSKSTISKYEKGEIIIDIETLYDIADALNVHIDELLYYSQELTPIVTNSSIPSFFEGVKQFYAYVFDGRNNQIIRCVYDVLSNNNEQYQIMMYMNFKSYEHYQRCENTYYGYMEHYDAVTNIMMTNQDSPIEKASAHILASYLSSDTKWGLFTGLSSRPMMPIATKMLFSKVILEGNEELVNQLKISKEDIRILRSYNMLSIM